MRTRYRTFYGNFYPQQTQPGRTGQAGIEMMSQNLTLLLVMLDEAQLNI
jgi:hypothetical protein